MAWELDFIPSYAHGYVSLYSEQPALPYVADLLSVNTQSHMDIFTCFSLVTNRPYLVLSFKE